MIGGSTLTGLGLGIALALSHVLFISGIIVIIFHQQKRIKIVHCFLAAIGCVGVILVLWYYLIDGANQKIIVVIPSERYPRNLTHDPSLNGNYSYTFFTYGSGFDHRSEYGTKASIITPTIDLSSIITLSSFNRRAFKYSESALPLNGRIWHPIKSSNQTGSYPVVILLHGNHASTGSSELGYDYLGTMLASQGFIAVSIDENFLNVAPTFSPIGYGKISTIRKYGLNFHSGPELMARAIIILETLKQLRQWTNESNNRLYNQIDVSNVGLMGHSRAGEAIVIAQVFNKLKFLPDYPGGVSFTDYEFGIKALFSIGGTDDGYMPLGHSLISEDVTMFGIHGVYDGDLSSFLFQAKLRHLRFTSNSSQYNFKASVYVHQANHGQFNTDWGRFDLIPGASRFMNVHPLLTMLQQQHICKIYMAALMNLVLKNQTHYRALFEDYRSAMSYLPYTNYISTFQDSNETVVADFEHYDVTQGTITGSKVSVVNLLHWGSAYVKVYRSAMLVLQPMNNSVGKYAIHFQNAIAGSWIRFQVCRAPEGLVDHLTVQLFYDNGTSDSFVVNVLPALGKRIFKASSTEYVTAIQTISLPLLRPMVGLEFMVDGVNAQFLVDDIVLAN
ncbi:unnamed protein product [Rotaria sp. Silwood2]|nr:unnamed protein product [Rotaria sp. Silwood2]